MEIPHGPLVAHQSAEMRTITAGARGWAGAVLLAGVLLMPQVTAARDRDDRHQSSRPRVRLGGITVGAGYTHVSGGYPGFWGYPYWAGSPWYWSSPYYYSWFPMGYYHPAYFGGFSQGPGMGEVKLRNTAKDIEVYVDGGFAGNADKLKTMWLEPGAYNLELKGSQGAYKKRIYVLSGKRITLQPEFRAVQPEEATP